MEWLNKLSKLICTKLDLPLWTYGLECDVCKMTLVSPEAHLDHARKQRTIKKHEGKIPILR